MSINLTLGAIVVLLAGLVLNFKSSKERQENGEWSSGLQWSYLLCMVGVFGILSEFMSFTAVLLVFVVFTGIVWAIHKGRLKKRFCLHVVSFGLNFQTAWRVGWDVV